MHSIYPNQAICPPGSSVDNRYETTEIFINGESCEISDIASQSTQSFSEPLSGVASLHPSGNSRPTQSHRRECPVRRAQSPASLPSPGRARRSPAHTCNPTPAQFAARLVQPPFDHLFVGYVLRLAAVAQPHLQHLGARRQNKNRHRRPATLFITCIAPCTSMSSSRSLPAARA